MYVFVLRCFIVFGLTAHTKHIILHLLLYWCCSESFCKSDAIYRDAMYTFDVGIYMRLSEWEGLATKYSSKSLCELYPAGMTPWIAICLAGQRFFSNWMPSHNYGGFAFKIVLCLPPLLTPTHHRLIFYYSFNRLLSYQILRILCASVWEWKHARAGWKVGTCNSMMCWCAGGLGPAKTAGSEL